MSMFRRMMMKPISNNIILIDKADSVAGDICIADNNKNLLFCRFVDSGATHKLSDYTPIGLTVVPASHNHYADDKCAIMSLNHMNCNMPQTGANSVQSMSWGDDSVDISSLPNLDQVPYVGSNGNVEASVIGQTNYAYLPSDHPDFTAVANPYDTKTKYYYNNSDKYIPSPYNNDGTFNPNYSLTTSPSSTANCLADFDGYNNTKKIIEVRGSKDYSSWKPGQYTQEDYPAASCCDMYFIQGTNQGEWYLPSAGELGYVFVRIQSINDTISKLISAGVTNASTVSLSYYWSSSERSSNRARYVYFVDGRVCHTGYKYIKNYVRAFHLV